MTEQPHEAISDLSEISDARTSTEGAYFLGSILWGTLTGTLALMALGLSSDPSGIDPVEAIGLAAFLAIFVAGFTLAGMLVIGLPITFLLRALEWEKAWLYATLGAIAGFLFLAIMFERPLSTDLTAMIAPASGGLAGFATALSWGVWREKRAALRHREHFGSAPEKRDNPIHDLIH